MTSVRLDIECFVNNEKQCKLIQLIFMIAQGKLQYNFSVSLIKDDELMIDSNISLTGLRISLAKVSGW